MYNQTEAILSQYELEIHEVKKGRGSHICQTAQGMKLLVPFRGSNEKAVVLKEMLEQLRNYGFSVEQIVVNREGNVVTRDEVTGESFLLKDYISGVELNVTNKEELRSAISLLALYHRAAERVHVNLPKHLQETEGIVVESRKRHYREIIKTKNYIRNRKKKSEFEQLYMEAFPQMLATMERSIAILEEQTAPRCILCHGEVNQHNILCDNGNWHLVNFENFTYSWRMVDLANFLRKIMEKNNWDSNLGKELLEIYGGCIALEEEEWRRLYGLLLFPERFWKITNHYMNSRKSWISGRDIEKMERVITQESGRLDFMENMFSFLQ